MAQLVEQFFFNPQPLSSGFCWDHECWWTLTSPQPTFSNTVVYKSSVEQFLIRRFSAKEKEAGNGYNFSYNQHTVRGHQPKIVGKLFLKVVV